MFQSRTSQGATAWFIGLIGFPYLGIPLFIIFGRRRYHDEADEPLFDLSHMEMIQHKKPSLGEFERFLRHTGSGFTGKIPLISLSMEKVFISL